MPAPRRKKQSGADRIREAADTGQTPGSYPADTRQTAGRQPADNRQTLERRNLRLPPSHWEALEAIAARQSRHVSELVREAVREYLDRNR